LRNDQPAGKSKQFGNHFVPDLSREFFAVVQNKMHWAAHGHTAAEIVASRADSNKPIMGLTSWGGR